MSEYLSFNYWLHMRPGSVSQAALWQFIIFIGILVFLSLVFYFLKKKKTGLYYKTWQRLSSYCVVNIIIGFFILFFSFEEIPILSARFWLLLWIIGQIGWLGYILFSLSKIPKIREKLAKEEEFNKYIP